jgi:hypothetical protein
VFLKLGDKIMNRDVFLSILAMDSYSRGYSTAIDNLGAEGTSIGNATILRQSDVDAGTRGRNASFYGVAYTMSASSGFNSGERVIAYRGTDDLGFTGWNPISWLIDGDVWNGWGIGTGSPGGTQARLAVDFYQAVVGAANNNVNHHFHSRFLRAA